LTIIKEWRGVLQQSKMTSVAPRRSRHLSTHSAGALYQALTPDEARRVLRRLEFHYIPKHTSWLKMVEIEIGVLRSQCLDRRIDSQQPLQSPLENNSAMPQEPDPTGLRSA
jgi:hypothetical protein